MKRCATAVLAVALVFPTTVQASVTNYLWFPRHITEASPNPSSLFKTQTVKTKQLYLGSPTLRGVYMKGSRSNTQSSFPASWYLRDASGSKVTDSAHGYYIMDPLSGWKDHVASACQRLTSLKGATICYVDGLGPYSLDRASSPLIDPRTNQPYTVARWLADAGVEVKAVEDVSSSFHVVANSVAGGSMYFNKVSPTSLLATGWGASAEQFGPGRPGQDIKMIQSTHLWAITKSDSASVRRKALAVFLLGAGPGDRFDSYSWSDGAGTWYPEYNLNLGHPKAKVSQISRHVWKRPFSNGVVFLNNSTRSVRVKAGGHWYTLKPKKQRFIAF